MNLQLQQQNQWLKRLRDGAFASLGDCQVNPVVLRIRDDGPALLDDLVSPLPSLGRDTAARAPRP
jgi:hypothetical protein